VSWEPTTRCCVPIPRDLPSSRLSPRSGLGADVRQPLLGATLACKENMIAQVRRSWLARTLHELGFRQVLRSKTF
jgi:hypothetical protein